MALVLDPTPSRRTVVTDFDEREEISTAVTDAPAQRSAGSERKGDLDPVNRAILLRIDGVSAGEVVSLRELPFVIGRRPQCNLVIDDPDVSRRHSRVVFDEGLHIIEDYGSRNGTFVEGLRVQRHRLFDGCFVQLGPHVGFRFMLVDERRESVLKQLYLSSVRDALTGLFNRRYFDIRLSGEIAYARRHGTDVAFLLVDIDFFKAVNDSYGHAVGDGVLKHVARVLARQLRVEDVVARVGGEEFAILLRGTDITGAARLGERLRSAVAQGPAVVDDSVAPVTVSVGCSAFSELKEPDGPALFAQADERLYAAKRGGRNRVVAS